MTFNELVTIFRREALDEATPNLWQDEELLEFANDAVLQAARRARLLVDSRTPELCNVSTVANNPWVDIDPRIIFIRRVVVQDSGKKLQKFQQRILDEMHPGWELSSSNAISGYIYGLDANTIRVYPTPTEVIPLNLTIIREPLVPMEGSEDEPEFPARYHRSLVYWMLYRAFSKKDEDTEDSAVAKLNYALFEAEFGKMSPAYDEKWANMHYGMDDFEGQY
jgi:hypothetical protein